MLLWEKELKRKKSELKNLLYILGFLIFLFASYYIYYSFFDKENFLFKTSGKMDVMSYGYYLKDVDKIIVDFDDEFLGEAKYKSLKERNYENLSDRETGRKNPFQPYGE